MKTYSIDRKEYPFTSRYFQHPEGYQHYLDEGQGPVLLLIHGTPGWTFDFRHLIKGLSPHYRCIAMDHLGFGLSDKPARADYSLSAHRQRAEALLQHLQVSEFHLLLHDFGGPIGMDLATRNPRTVKSLLLLNTWFWDSLHEPEYRKLLPLLKSPLLPFLYRHLNFSPRFLLPGSFGGKKLRKGLLRNYTVVFDGPNERFGPLAFAHSLIHDQEVFGTLWEKSRIFREIPVALCWGMKDRVLPPKGLHKLELAFPKHESLELEEAGHYPQEEEPEACLRFFLSFLKRFD